MRNSCNDYPEGVTIHISDWSGHDASSSPSSPDHHQMRKQRETTSLPGLSERDDDPEIVQSQDHRSVPASCMVAQSVDCMIRFW